MTIRILEGDSREMLKTLPAESVHCVVTSPPYWGLRDYGHAGQIGMEDSPQAFVDALVQVLAEVHRVLRPDGTLWLNLGDSYAAQRGGTAMPAETLAGGVGGRGDEAAHRGRPTDTLGGRQDESSPEIRTFAVAHRNAKSYGLKHKDLVGIPWRVAFGAQAWGWYLRSDIIWHKPNPMPESVTDRPTSAHEHIFLLAKSERYYFDSAAVKEPDVAGHKSGNGYARVDTKNVGYRLSYGGRGQEEHWEPGEGRNIRNVWTIATKPYSGAHFATFPPKLIEPCILAGCPEGGTVLDPFGGAGTTGLVADRLKRNAILVELNPIYAQIARDRITGDAPLFAEVF